MIYQLAVPAVADDVQEIRILEWHGAPGHAFVAGDLIVEFETHKAVVEVRAGQSGRLWRILAPTGTWSAIGGVIALFSDDGGDDAREDVGDAAAFAVDFLID